MRRRTVAQFLAEASRVHNGRYSYPGLRFVHSQQKIDIECVEHGIFQQSPQKHLAGQGCRKCRPKPQPQSRDAFIEKARAIHGQKFDYDRVVYVNNHTPVTIVCRASGHLFSMLPSNHTHPRFPQGCRECSGRARWSLEHFLREARKVHGEKYSYEQIKEVTDGRTKLPIFCREGHGTFMQSPAHHIYRKQGCAECAGVKKGSAERFVKQARGVHGDRFSYELVDYDTTHVDVRIICNSCGHEFLQTPANHLRSKSPCPKCSGGSVDTSEFIKRSRLRHGDHYDYSESVYVSRSQRITIICPYHGPFEQLPFVHVSGSGCKVCRNSQGHHVIKQGLERAGIPFEEEYPIRDGVGSMPLWFDFAIVIDEKLVAAIEFHGAQHDTPVNYGSGKGNAEDQLRRIQARDQRKRDWCLRNGIELLEIRDLDTAADLAARFSRAMVDRLKLS